MIYIFKIKKFIIKIFFLKKKINLYFLFNILLIFIISKNVIAQSEIKNNLENGYSLYKVNCASCHSIDLKKKLIGPPLYGVTEKRSREWLHKWIKNNQSLRDSGDKDAISIYKEYSSIQMNLFPELSENDIDDIIYFIKNPVINNINKKEINTDKINNFQENISNETYKKITIVGLIILSFILLFILNRLYNLIIIIKSENINEYLKYKNKKLINFKKIIKIYKNKFYFLLYSLLCIFSFIYFFILWNFLMKIDVNKGYQPDQPIYFSHKIHSEINKINCQYCHSSGKYSKVSGIPSINICMNCHVSIDKYNGKYIENGKNINFYNSEIKKIYEYSGWDPDQNIYIKKSKPIRWVRIHNMPDFVYFDHSQHIIIGEKSIKKSKNVNTVCNACHGEVEKMNKIKMANDFTMGWCINCHRSTEIDKENKYYKQYFTNLFKANKKYHNKNKKIMVSDIGGTECSKCHY